MGQAWQQLLPKKLQPYPRTPWSAYCCLCALSTRLSDQRPEPRVTRISLVGAIATIPRPHQVQGYARYSTDVSKAGALLWMLSLLGGMLVSASRFVMAPVGGGAQPAIRLLLA